MFWAFLLLHYMVINESCSLKHGSVSPVLKERKENPLQHLFFATKGV